MGTAAITDGKVQRNEERREGRKAGGGGRINKVYKEDGKGKERDNERCEADGKGTKGQTEKDRERKEGRKKGIGRKDRTNAITQGESLGSLQLVFIVYLCVYLLKLVLNCFIGFWTSTQLLETQ